MPVFDASTRNRNESFLNQCLEKGFDLIELIPSIFIKFREKWISIIAAIKKFFLQISVNKAGRGYLRFLWMDRSNNEIIF